MKNRFKAYYPLSEDKKKEIFNDSNTYFVFDTNALLDIYRLGKTVSSKVIKLFKKYEGRIVIPYHVAEEYHDHLFDIMIEGESLYNNLSEKVTEDYIMRLIEQDNKVQFNYGHLSKMLKKHIKDAIAVFKKKILNEKKFISEQLSSWTLPNELAEFLGDKILDKFSDEDIAKIEEEGKGRFEAKLPPGHEDKDKTKNKYGDLIIWKELLKFAGEHPDNSIVFVSRDIEKGDWQWIQHGRKCGLHPYLLNEFYNVSNAHILMYPLQDFINYANETGKVFNKTEIGQIQEIKLPDISSSNATWERQFSREFARPIGQEFSAEGESKQSNEKDKELSIEDVSGDSTIFDQSNLEIDLGL